MAQACHRATGSDALAAEGDGSMSIRCSRQKCFARSSGPASAVSVVGGTKAPSNAAAQAAAAAAKTAASSQRFGSGQGCSGCSSASTDKGKRTFGHNIAPAISITAQQQPAIVNSTIGNGRNRPASPSNSRIPAAAVIPRPKLNAAVAGPSVSPAPSSRHSGRPSPYAATAIAANTKIERNEFPIISPLSFRERGRG